MVRKCAVQNTSQPLVLDAMVLSFYVAYSNWICTLMVVFKIGFSSSRFVSNE